MSTDVTQKSNVNRVRGSRPTGEIKSVRQKQVYAGPCPMNERHLNTGVYNTSGRTRHCKCNDCGHTWKQTGKFADPLKEYCMQLAEQFSQAERVDAPDGKSKVIYMTDATAKELAKTLTVLVEAG